MELQAGSEKQLFGAVMANSGSHRASHLCFLSACAYKTGCRGLAACSWHPCSQCLRARREQGSQSDQGWAQGCGRGRFLQTTNCPSLPRTAGFLGHGASGLNPGESLANQDSWSLRPESQDPSQHPASLLPSSPPLHPSLGAPNTATPQGLASLDSPFPETSGPGLFSPGPLLLG